MGLVRFTRRLLAGTGGLVAAPGVVAAAYLTIVEAAAAKVLRVDPPAPKAPPSRRFRILIPAYNEATGIAETIESLRAVDYPAELFEIHVAADNCTDTTAQVARQSGAVAHERTNVDEPGKGAALAWLIDALPEYSDDDAFVIVDADTIVTKHLLTAFDHALDSSPVVQGHYRVRDDEAGDDIGFRAIALAVRHLVRPAGRTELGGSSSLYGNGMAFHESTARRYRWNNTLTEDLDMGLTLLLDGHKVGFARHAEVAAEMPTTLDAAESQNQRWEAGRLEVATNHVPSLVNAARQQRHGQRWPYIDAIIDITMLPFTTLMASTIAAAGIIAAFGRGSFRRFGFVTSAISAGLLIRHVFKALDHADAPPEVRRALTRAPLQMLWKAKLLLKVLQRQPDAWVRTTRNDEPAPERSS